MIWNSIYDMITSIHRHRHTFLKCVVLCQQSHNLMNKPNLQRCIGILPEPGQKPEQKLVKVSLSSTFDTLLPTTHWNEKTDSRYAWCNVYRTLSLKRTILKLRFFNDYILKLSKLDNKKLLSPFSKVSMWKKPGKMTRIG